MVEPRSRRPEAANAATELAERKIPMDRKTSRELLGMEWAPLQIWEPAHQVRRSPHIVGPTINAPVTHFNRAASRTPPDWPVQAGRVLRRFPSSRPSFPD